MALVLPLAASVALAAGLPRLLLRRLLPGSALGRVRSGTARGPTRLLLRPGLRHRPLRRAGGGGAAPGRADRRLPQRQPAVALHGPPEIGRASCRECVCVL